jgi:ankyrin repeat protein
MSVRGRHAHYRPELFELISGRSRHSYYAKIGKESAFDDNAYTQMVVEKIEQSSDLTYNEDGFTYLHLAVQDREPVFVQALLDKGLDVNAKTSKGISPLHMALSNYKLGDMDMVVKILLETGAERNIDFGGMPVKEFAKLVGASKFFGD